MGCCDVPNPLVKLIKGRIGFPLTWCLERRIRTTVKFVQRYGFFVVFLLVFFFKHSMVTLVLNKLKKHCIRLSIVGCIRQPLRNLLRPYLTTRILQLVTTEEGVKPACIKKHACSNDHDLTDIVIARSWL